MNEAAATEEAPTTVTPSVVEPAAGTPTSPQHESSDPSASPSPAAVSDDRSAKKEAKRKRDAEKAAVRRRLADLQEAGSVKELEQKLFEKFGKPHTAAAASSSATPAAAATVAGAVVGNLPAAPVKATPEQVKAWREATEKLLGSLNQIAKIALEEKHPTLPLTDEELALLNKAAPPVLAKYLPELLVSDELVLLGVVISIAIPRVLPFILSPTTQTSGTIEQPPPTGKAAA